MPPSFQTSHGPKAFVANKVFTDRQKPLRLFEDALASPPVLDARRVLTFYGVGGEGKTALAGEFVRLLERNFAGHAGWAKINFGDARLRATDEGLLTLSLQFRETADVQFPTFDTAFIRLFALRRRGADIRAAHPELFRSGSEVIEDILSLGNELIPSLNLFYKYGSRFPQRVQNWWHRRGKKTLEGLDKLDGDSLLAKLPSYFGADLCDAMATAPRRKPFVIVGDTCEAFHHGQGLKTGLGAFDNDLWLRDLIQETPGALFILLSRDQLRWAEVDARWGEVVHQHRLGILADPDARSFLTNAGVAEPDIRDRIVEGAEGLPFYLDLQVNLYQTLRNAGETPDAKRFGGSQPEIIARFIGHLGQEAARLFVVLAHARRFDEPLFLHLAQVFCGGLPPLSFGDVKSLSFTERLGNQVYMLHALMREELTARAKADELYLHRKIHAALFAWWDTRCRPTDMRSITAAHELALREAAFHLAECRPRSLRPWSARRGTRFFEGGRYAVVGDVWLQAAIVAEATYGPRHWITGKALGNYSSVLAMIDRLAEARKMKEKVSEIFFAELGLNHPQVAKNLINLGVVQRRQKDFGMARQTLEHALKINTLIYHANHLEVFNNLINLGFVFGDLNEHLEARQLHLRAFAIGRKNSYNKHQMARALNNLGRPLSGLGKHKAARRVYERALAFKEQLYRPDHQEIASTLTNLGDTQEILGEPIIARELRERALTIYTAAFGPDHQFTRLISDALKKSASETAVEPVSDNEID